MKVVTGIGGENLGICYVVGSLFQEKLMSECSQGEMEMEGWRATGSGHSVSWE